MAQGRQKTAKEVAEIKMALALNPENVSEAARLCGQPESTVRAYRLKWQNDPGFAKFCEAKREEFERGANEIIYKALKALSANLEYVVNDPEATKALRPERYAAMIGTLIDKQQLLNHGPTEIIAGVERFEDL